MECSTRRMEQVAKLLAEEIGEKLAGKQDVNEMERMMRELVKEAANLGMQQAIEQGEETYGSRVVICPCGQKAQFVSKRLAVIWTVFGKVDYRRRYYLCPKCHQGQSPLDLKYGIVPGQTTHTLASLLGVLGVEVSFGEASRLAERFFLFRVSDNTVRKQTEGYGNAKRKQKKNGSKMRKTKKLCKSANAVWNISLDVFMPPSTVHMCRYSMNGGNSRPCAGIKWRKFAPLSLESIIGKRLMNRAICRPRI